MSAASNINTSIAGARHSADDRVQPGEVAVKAAASSTDDFNAGTRRAGSIRR
jgi:hypothetical protein